MSNCIGEPLSFLRLEQYALRELPSRELYQVERHLSRCEACRLCLREVERPLVLPDLPAREQSDEARANLSVRALTWLRPALWPTLALVGIATALLLMFRNVPDFDYPAARLMVKGGEMAIGLVREHEGNVANDPRVFTLDDRFKILVTCPPTMTPNVDVVVFQGSQIDFPLKAERVSRCGNQIPLPGAFRVTGRSDAVVCLVANDSRAIDRDAIRARGPLALPDLSVCEQIRPAR